MKTFIYFILILSFINITIFSNVNAFSITEYETSTLFKDDDYEYKITYPVSEDNEWFLYHGTTDTSVIKFKGEILNSLAVIIKQKTFGFGCSIEVYILNKDSSVYKTLSNPLKKEDSNTLFFDIQNKEKKINFEDIYKRSLNEDDNLLTVIYNLNQNKAILFIIDENVKDKKEISKDIYKIINSLTREKIDNKNNN